MHGALLRRCSISRAVCYWGWMLLALSLHAATAGAVQVTPTQEPATNSPPAANDADRPTAPANVELTSVRVGLGGMYKVGCWTPIDISLRAPRDAAAKVIVVVRDPEGVPARYPLTLTTSPSPGATADTSYAGVVRPASLADTWEVRWESPSAVRSWSLATDAAETSLRIPPARPTHEELWLLVGGTLDVQPLARLLRQDRETNVLTSALVAQFAELPRHWSGYEGLSVVVLSIGAEPHAASAADFTTAWQALDEWVTQGGTLLVSVAAAGQTLFAPGGAWQRFAPGNFLRMQKVRAWSTWEAFSETSVPLVDVSSGGDLSAGTDVPMFSAVRGIVEANEGELPLVVRSPRGFGQVIYVAADLHRPPFADWPARGELLARLLRRDLLGNSEEATALASRGGQVSWLGVTDLAGQLHGALDQFPGLKALPFWLIALAMVGYVVLIGPVDYLLVRTLLKRMEFTWITLPFAVLAVSTAAYLLAVHWKGHTLRVNQLDLVDIDVDSGLVRGTTWFRLYSPRAQALDVHLQPPEFASRATMATATPAVAPTSAAPAAVANLPSEILLGAFGPPGTGVGGLDAPAVLAPACDTPYSLSDSRHAAQQVPLPPWSSKGFVARWSHRRPPAIDSQLSAGPNDLPQGTITNTSGITLTDGLLAVGRWGILLEKDFAPGDTLDLSDPALELNRTELQTRLTRRTMIYDDQTKQFVQRAQPYDVASHDVNQIARQMMFYGAAGGPTYTRLAHRLQAFVDLSGLLAAGRAVLLGRVDLPQQSTETGATLHLSAPPSPPTQVARTRFVRFVLPVTPDTLP